MYLLVIIIYLLAGPPEVRTSIVSGPTAYNECVDALPLEIKLYKEGKFVDGPPVKMIRAVRGECQGLPDEIEIVRR